MLRKVLMGLGALCLMGALLVLTTGQGMVVLPHLLAGALILGLGVAFESWRYKRISPQAVDPRWQDTGERFVDPETGQLTAVYHDPANGERHYIAKRPDSHPS